MKRQRTDSRAGMVWHGLDPRLSGLPAAQRVYAVGDVHGHLDRLLRVHDLIRADLKARPCADAVLVHLGDYIDRGPDSAGVVSHLLAGPPAPGLKVVNLRGNHEAMLLSALTGDRRAVEDWLHNGGLEALHSWGIPVRGRALDWPALLPPGHLEFLQGLALHWACAGALFVHAGVRPGIALPDQAPDDLLWIRGAFLRWDRTMLPDAPDALIVHGHTPAPAPELRPNRLNLDTGAGKGGPLTCGVIEGMEVGFLQG